MYMNNTPSTQFTHNQVCAMEALLEDRSPDFGQATVDLHMRIWDAAEAGKSLTLSEDERVIFCNAGTEAVFWHRVDEFDYFSAREMRTYTTMLSKMEAGLVTLNYPGLVPLNY